jgi:phenylacetate-CoA ligase
MMKNWYPRLLRSTIYPFSQRVLKRNFSRMMAEAEQNQFKSRDEIQAIQFRKLSNLIGHAYNTVPYYREVFTSKGIHPADIRSWDDYHQLPILKRERYQETPEKFLSSRPRSATQMIRSSGSTGRPAIFYLSQMLSAAANVSRIRALQWWGIHLGDREVRIWADMPRLLPGFWNPKRRRWKRFFRDRVLNRRTYSANEMSDFIMEKTWRSIQRFAPKYIFGYASFMYQLARFIDKSGYDGRALGLKIAVISAEMLYDPQIEFIQDILGCPVVNEYGATEVGVIAYSHPCGENHIMDDFIIFEIAKSDPTDEFGKVVITPLENWGCPLIRYDLEDLVVPWKSENTCSLGLGLGRFKSLYGRQYDLIVLPGGKIVHGHLFSNLIFFAKCVRQFQVIQKEPDLIEISLETVNNELPEEDENFLRDKIRKNLGPVRVEIKLVAEIPREDSGKYRFVQSRVSAG